MAKKRRKSSCAGKTQSQCKKAPGCTPVKGSKGRKASCRTKRRRKR